jgi:hypothetical protein
MTGKYGLLLRLLADVGERSLFISTGTDAASVRSDYAAVRPDVDEESVGVVDCVTRAQRPSAADTETVKYVSSPENLTEIGVKFTCLAEHFGALTEASTNVGVGLYSVSQLLMYWDTPQVYQFLRVLGGQIKNSNWTGVAVIGSTMHDTQTLHTLYDPFDAIIETREGESGCELRMRTRGEGSSGWTSF